jgi:hypothetical protein
VFVNAFAANDPESTETIWRMTTERHADIEHVVAVFNLRADRADRTRQLARDTKFWHEAGDVVLMGSGAYHFARAAAEVDGAPTRFTYADHDQIVDVFEIIIELCEERTLVVGLGNIGEQGLALSKMFKNRRDLHRARN